MGLQTPRLGEGSSVSTLQTFMRTTWHPCWTRMESRSGQDTTAPNLSWRGLESPQLLEQVSIFTILKRRSIVSSAPSSGQVESSRFEFSLFRDHTRLLPPSQKQGNLGTRTDQRQGLQPTMRRHHRNAIGGGQEQQRKRCAIQRSGMRDQSSLSVHADGACEGKDD